MIVECEVEPTTLEGDHGLVESVEATCSRCGNRTEAFGFEERSIRRCLAQMRDTCPKGERNVYVDEHEGARGRPTRLPTPTAPAAATARTRRVDVVSEVRVERWRKASATPDDVQAAYIECFEMSAPSSTAQPDETRAVNVRTDPTTVHQCVEWWYEIGPGVFAVVSTERDLTVMETVYRSVISIDCGK